MCDFKPITESKDFIVLDKYTKMENKDTNYQTEADLESELIADLINQGYEHKKSLTNPKAMLDNARDCLQTLNDVCFSDLEWARFCDEYLNKPSDNQIDRTSKLHNDYIYDFTFDDGYVKNIYLMDKKNITKNKVQVISQFEQTGSQANRYDITILVNGLPLVQVELKNVELQFVKHLIRFIDIVKRVLTLKILYLSIYKFL